MLLGWFMLKKMKHPKNNFQREWIAKGIRRLINTVKGQNFIAATNNTLSLIIKQVPEERQLDLRKDFFELSFADISTEEGWKSIANILNDILKEFGLTANKKTAKFIL